MAAIIGRVNEIISETSDQVRELAVTAKEISKNPMGIRELEMQTHRIKSRYPVKTPVPCRLRNVPCVYFGKPSRGPDLLTPPM